MNKRNDDTSSASASRGLANDFDSTAAIWSLTDREITFGRLPVLMGIVNVTPDSFSDGGNYFDPGKAVAHALKLAEGGAGILDIGGESTRPYSEPVDAGEEIRRVVPVIERLRDQTEAAISIDTSKAAVARAALDAGAQIINDVTGLEGDAEMPDVALNSNAGICAMHTQGTPQTMQDAPHYENVVEEIYDYLRLRRDALWNTGIEREKICLDPGIGFGKTHLHNLEITAGCHRYHGLGCPVMVGHSRKGFIGRLIGDKAADRDVATRALTILFATKAMQIVRVHEVCETRRALAAFDACGGIDGQINSVALR
ncbi:MAG: dihydropteroate synthase [Planctomycetota bacterium]